MAALYLDNDVATSVARHLTDLGHTATHTRNLDLTAAPDGY